MPRKTHFLSLQQRILELRSCVPQTTIKKINKTKLFTYHVRPVLNRMQRQTLMMMHCYQMNDKMCFSLSNSLMMLFLHAFCHHAIAVQRFQQRTGQYRLSCMSNTGHVYQYYNLTSLPRNSPNNKLAITCNYA